MYFKPFWTEMSHIIQVTVIESILDAGKYLAQTQQDVLWQQELITRFPCIYYCQYFKQNI